MGTQKASQKAQLIVDTTATAGGGGDDRSRDASGRRNFRVADERWVKHLAGFCARLDTCEIRFRRGRSDYRRWASFHFPIDVEDRGRFTKEDALKWATETADELWAKVVEKTEEDGPMLDFQLIGYAAPKKGSGAGVELFSQAARCDLSDSASHDYDDGDHTSSAGDVASMFKEMRTFNREMHGSLHKLVLGVVDPIKSAGELTSMNTERVMKTLEWQSGLAREELHKELSRMQGEMQKRRLDVLERVTNRTLDTIGADFFDLAKGFFRVYGEGPVTPDLRVISEELYKLHSVVQADKLPADLNADLMSLWGNTAANAATEEAAAMAWAAFHDELVAHLPGYRAAGSDRQRKLLSVARGRIAIFDAAVPGGGLGW